MKIKSLILFFVLFASSQCFAYENTETKVIDNITFANLLFANLNENRSFKGLLPLEIDRAASYVAKQHAEYLVNHDTLSYCNNKLQCPDERYTIAGGTGATVEIIKAFELSPDENVKLTELLTKNLLEALQVNEDDSRVLYNSFITHIGFGFATNKNKFVAIIEFVTNGGNFSPLDQNIALGEKLNIEGSMKPPFIFKAISVAYFDKNEYKSSNDDFFDSDHIPPYFPPQDYIAYGNISKQRFLKILKGLGFIGAIGASPFTGGASAILAPVFLHSLQNTPSKEIPLKSGIKVSSDGQFSGKVSLNYQSMTGLYFVSILAELKNIDYPIVVSRRTVNVRSPLEDTL